MSVPGSLRVHLQQALHRLGRKKLLDIADLKLIHLGALLLLLCNLLQNLGLKLVHFG